MKASEIAEFVNGELRGSGDPDIDSIADFGVAADGDIAFLEKDSRETTKASCVIVSRSVNSIEFGSCIVVDDPKLAFARIAPLLSLPKMHSPGISRLADIDETATLDDTVFVHSFVSIGQKTTIGSGSMIDSGSRIGDHVSIGVDCIIHSNAVIHDGCKIGNNVIIHSGVILGSDGFGYVKDDNGNHIKFPQIGSVVIEDDVEIGANSCIDRGALGETRIGAGTKIDNLVQIAHNVQIGKRCIIVAMSGISGSSILEDEVVLAGQVGIADHVTLKKGVVIGAKSAVFPNKTIASGIWCGIPAEPLKDYKRQHAILKSVGRLREQVRDLGRKMEEDKL